jgi:hypothetical protein
MLQKNKWSFLQYAAISCLACFTLSCQKEEFNNYSGNVEWIRVLQDTLTYSTDDPFYTGRNGKVITDSYDNYYVYYYSKNPEQTVVIKYNRAGELQWQKTINNCKPLDMARLNDGSILLAVSLSNQVPNYLTLYSINTDGTMSTKSDTLKNLFWVSEEVLNATISPTEGSGFVISGVWNGFVSGSNFAASSNEVFVVKHSQLQIRDWTQYLSSFCFTCPYVPTWPSGDRNGSSVIQTNNGQYVVQFGTYSDGSTAPAGSNLLTALLNPDGNADTSFMYNSVIYNRYGSGLFRDNTGNFISYYSSPREGINFSQTVPAGFLRIGQDSEVKDTIPLSIPKDYRIVSCAKGSAGFLLTAYKAGVANGGSDYSAERTLFLRGGNDWLATDQFTLQQFYSDFFFSHAPVSGGGFISMGRIQSFDGPVNKLVLIKWK